MPLEVKLMQTGAAPTECKIAQWHVADGHQVAVGDLLFTMETDKVSIEVEANAAGTLKHVVSEGAVLLSGEVAAQIFAEHEAATEILPDQTAAPQLATTVLTLKPLASPKARKLAASLDVDLHKVQGSGPKQRILSTDVLAAHQATAASPQDNKVTPIQKAQLAPLSSQAVQATPAGLKVPLSAMRKVIAERMLQSLHNSAQLTMTREAQVAELVKLRQSLLTEWDQLGLRPSYTDLMIKAVAKALRLHPMMNSSFAADGIVQHSQVNIGLAVAVEQGLYVPVIENADRLSLQQIAECSCQLVAAAKMGKLQPQQLQGGTFTISTLGMYGVDSFTPILNQPQAGILGVNRIFDGLEWDGDRPVKTAKMNLSLTWDHRVLDGAPAAAFLATVADLLAQPYRLLL